MRLDKKLFLLKMNRFKINRKIIIDYNSPTFIIAELGINHEGNFQLAKKMTHAAFLSGADAVKFQIVDADQSYSKNTLSYAMYKKSKLEDDQYKVLFNDFKSKGLVFATPGDFKSLDLCKKLNNPLYKISSGLLNNLPLLREINNTKKPIIASTGMADHNEILKLLSSFQSYRNNSVALLHCISLYPVSIDLINLNSIHYMKEKYKMIIGFSDHTLGYEASKMAVLAGAKIIEKHFTLDTHRKGYDHKISLDKIEFSKMVKSIRKIDRINGVYNKVPLKRELENKKRIERYCVAAKNIKKGEKFSAKNIFFKRLNKSSSYLKAFNFYKIENKKSKYAFKQDQPISISK